MHLFAENAPADAQNKFIVIQLNTGWVHIKPIDKTLSNLVFSETYFEFAKYAKLVLHVI